MVAAPGSDTHGVVLRRLPVQKPKCALTCARAACLPASLQEEDTVVVEAPGGSSATHLVVYRKGECTALPARLPARLPACPPAPCTGQPGSRRLTAAGICIHALLILSSPLPAGDNGAGPMVEQGSNQVELTP